MDIVIYLLRMYIGSIFRFLFCVVDISLLVWVAILDSNAFVKHNRRYGNAYTYFNILIFTSPRGSNMAAVRSKIRRNSKPDPTFISW